MHVASDRCRFGGSASLASILDAMRSRVAETLKQEQRARFAAMTPEQRAALAFRLGDEWIADSMSRSNLDRRAALEALRRSRRAGRKPSHSMDGRDAS